MKKVFSLILALVMTASLAIPCAAEEIAGNDTAGQEISTIPWFQQYFSEKIYSESECTLTPDQKTLLDENILNVIIQGGQVYRSLLLGRNRKINLTGFAKVIDG